MEITNLEPSSTFRHRTPFSSYASQVVPHGYTHKGQVIGSGIGPGASSQWLALDRLASTWSAGVFAGRIRWDTAAWLTSAVKRWGREDVSMFWGARGGVEVSGWGLFMDISHGVRINYLFQTFIPDPVSGKSRRSGCSEYLHLRYSSQKLMAVNKATDSEGVSYGSPWRQHDPKGVDP